ncbi:CDP-diacylglycerol--serine O-phosphatidyltransferase [Candidatus Aminicenantes bacterium AC-335-K20]|jgi:CDP-diacylglycerol--serine O-phosphatidyltransferase|nr:CDP-diacylglycerol--serine O-phosphatidyltransferase [SCandidatus Aminicenantes bacterium Aminicenantia_JdfR_composite]MCP2597027.1 CDP-diacylglycerol--serine O-phosphatidyltransferase [Candidatus Aminicenantes bacterium AC-335-G13]MCP2618960.1 CDP-diacylglycerol--serine O-phosphatidyltransferase [Candidatus Aminicenantes bacterium AC-335-A11]MCP2619360.1 CDP-diacylglycerol--serine O-phosphatidyltransferase [Candidatus Aminicenantes bacterium AC-335-K20]
MKKRKRRVTIFLLPSFLTTVNLFFGYLSIISILKGNYKLAAIWIVSASIIDAIDGIIARLTKTTSEFGLHFDSLADAISFGIAPCLLLYYWGFSKLTHYAWTFPFIYLVAGILRLARFNVYQGKYNDKRYSIGLSIPSASLMISAIVLFHPLPVNNQNYLLILSIFVLILSFLMISKLKYLSYKAMNFRKRKDLKTILIIGVILACAAIYTREFFLIFMFFYVFSAPVSLFIKKIITRTRLEKEVNNIST